MKLYKASIICSILGLMFIMIGTISYYSTSTNGNATVTTKKFSFDAYHNNKQLKIINLYDTMDTNDKNGDGIVPGDKGKFEIVLVGTGSGVNIDYKLSFSSERIPSNMKFYADNEENEIDITNCELTGKLIKGTEMKVTHTIYWKWPYDSGNSDDINYQGQEFVINVSAIGTQEIN